MSNDISSWLREHRITEVECIVPDMTGVARGKIIPKDKFLSEPDMRLPEAVLIQTVTGDYPADNYLDLTDPDMLLRPDPASIRFACKIGMNFVSCSPYRIPIARLAAAQAAIKQ